MDNIFVLLLAGFLIGTVGTLIGAGGGFILVPVLILTHRDLTPDTITAISMAIVAANALSGSIAYARSGRIDFKAGIVFALFTIPGSILGVYTTSYIPKTAFHLVFGVLLIALAAFLFFSKKQLRPHPAKDMGTRPGLRHRLLTDREGITYEYVYNQSTGIAISMLVGFISPLLGIGGGIIHVPALVNWLHFPVYVATATSHFILAVMSTVSVITNIIKGSYNDPYVLRMVLGLSGGVIVGAQLGALLSHKIKGHSIIRALAICLAIVGIRILISPFLTPGHT
ncbi:MAG: sulfite exporter TauE/SafE family protein [Bacteroidetes bacterium]|nr:sulfite exporter TauE/SafE family protein [Bacteroidota bacterium]